MSPSPFRQCPPPAPLDEPKVPDFHQREVPSIGAKVFGVVFSFYWMVTLVEVVRAGGVVAMALCLVWVSLPLTACLAYRHFAARVEAWKSRHVAREVARLMARDDAQWDPRATVRKYR